MITVTTLAVLLALSLVLNACFLLVYVVAHLGEYVDKVSNPLGASVGASLKMALSGAYLAWRKGIVKQLVLYALHIPMKDEQ